METIEIRAVWSFIGMAIAFSITSELLLMIGYAVIIAIGLECLERLVIRIVKKRPKDISEQDRAEIARARAGRRGLVAVPTPEGFEEATPEQAQTIPSVAEQERVLAAGEIAQPVFLKILFDVS